MTATDIAIDNLKFSALNHTEDGRVTIHEIARHLRPNGISVSNFQILKAIDVALDTPPIWSLNDTELEAIKAPLKEILAVAAVKREDPHEKSKLLEKWKFYSGFDDESGEIPLIKLDDILFEEKLNPTKTLRKALKSLFSQDEKDHFTFSEFCEMMTYLPSKALADKDTLMRAFKDMDPRGTGTISKEEITQLVTKYGDDPLNEEELEEFFTEFGDVQDFNYLDWIQRHIPDQGTYKY